MDKLSRIYPGGFRTDSSNYNPVPMWNVGCQIGTISLPLIQPLAAIDVFRVFNSFALWNVFFFFSGLEFPNSLQRDAAKPGPVPVKWLLRLHPETRVHARPVFSVWSQHTKQRALAEEEDLSHHGEIHFRWNLTKEPNGRTSKNVSNTQNMLKKKKTILVMQPSGNKQAVKIMKHNIKKSRKRNT